MKSKNLFYKIFRFYYEGFISMTVGKKLWLIIIIKLFVMFVVLRVFFFKNFLNERFNNNKDKSEYVIDQLTKP
jgi:uncharacterized membrane protein